MKIGVTKLVTGALTVEECVDLCQEAGYEAFELVFRGGTNLDIGVGDEELAAIRELFAGAGIEISGVTGGFKERTNLLSLDRELVERGKDELVRLLEIAGKLDVDAVLLHPGQLGVDGTYSQVWDSFRGSMEEMVPVAEENGVRICVENVWNKFLLSPREMRQFVDEVGSEWVRVYLDTANMMAYGYPEHWIRELGERIHRVHFKDFARGDHQFVDLMEGDTDWPTVIGELRGIGYDGPVVHEVGGDWEKQVEMAERMRRIVNLA